MKKESGNYLINTKHGIQFLGNEFHRLNAIYNIIGREQYSRTISSSSSFFMSSCAFSLFLSLLGYHSLVFTQQRQLVP